MQIFRTISTIFPKDDALIYWISSSSSALRIVLIARHDWYVRTLTPTGSSPSANIIWGRFVSLSSTPCGGGSPTPRDSIGYSRKDNEVTSG